VSTPRDIADDLEPGSSAELVQLGERLRDQRPLPSAAFRGELGRRLMRQRHSRVSERLARRLIAGYAAAGTGLMAVAALVATGRAF
jgi:hypothetical protein